jgi:alanine racemase
MLPSNSRKLLYDWRQRNRKNYKTLSWIELNRAALLDNFNFFKSTNPKLDVFPVLKANAYGHGLIEISKILNKVNCPFLVVDGYFEANTIRFHTNHKILVLGYILPENVGSLDLKRCSFVVQDVESLEAFGRLKKPVRVHMELNTGMNRLGLRANEIKDYLDTLKRFPSIEVEGIMSHLADADNYQSDAFTVMQVKKFDKMVETIKGMGFSPKYIHLAQTAGSLTVKSRYANSFRLGIGLYGITPLSPKHPKYKQLLEIRPVLELKSTIIKVIKLNKGEKVSYGGTYTAQKAEQIGVLPLGYYEGVPRQLSNSGSVTAASKILPIRGRVCMDHTMISLADTGLEQYDVVTVISPKPTDPNSVSNISLKLDGFEYTILTGLSESIRRVVV